MNKYNESVVVSLEPYEKYMALGKQEMIKKNPDVARSHFLNAYSLALEKLENESNPAKRTKLNKALDKLNTLTTQLLPKDDLDSKILISAPTGGRAKSKSSKDKNYVGIEEILSPTVPKTDFSHVAGMDEIKNELMRSLILPILYPEQYERAVGKGVTGKIIYGPSGCGKTHLCNSLAGQAKKVTKSNITFYKMHGGTLRGSGNTEIEDHVRTLFKIVARSEPAVLFIDEIETAVPSRVGKNNKDIRITDAILDAFEELEGKNVMVVAATNYPHKLDFGIMSSHRLGYPAFIPPPDVETREKLFKLYMKGKPQEEDIDFQYLAAISSERTCSDIKYIVTEAGKAAVEYQVSQNPKVQAKISMNDLESAIDERRPTLKAWKAQIEDDLLDGRYPNEKRIKKGIEADIASTILDALAGMNCEEYENQATVDVYEVPDEGYFPNLEDEQISEDDLDQDFDLEWGDSSEEE